MVKKNAETTETTETTTKTRGPRWSVAVQGLRPTTSADLRSLCNDFAIASLAKPELAEIAKMLVDAAKAFDALK